MLGYISSFFTKNNFNIENISPLLISISSQNDLSKVKDLFPKCVENLPLNGSAEVELKKTFETFDNLQIKNFSNNLISYMKLQMNDKINLLNQSVQLMLHFVSSIYQKLNSINEFICNSFDEIINDNKDAKEIISVSFPYNILIYCIDTLNNDTFLYQRDIFQKEMDKFDFTYKLTAIVFFIIHNRDSPMNKNMSTSIECIDTFKLFIYNGKDLFVSKKKQENFFEKLYNTSIHNFDVILTNRVDPNIDIDSFEIFLFMNIYIFLFLCCDINKFIFKDIIENKKKSISFNLKSIEVAKKLLKIEKDEDLLILNNEYFELNNNLLKKFLFNSLSNFRKFIFDFYNNLERLTTYFRIMIKNIILYSFTIYPDISEMISLNLDIINFFIDKMTYDNAFDLMVLFLFSKCKNFYISLKHLEISVEALSLNCLTNIINQRLNYNKKFTYSIYFSLLNARSLSENIYEITNDSFSYLLNFISYIQSCEITTENIFDNMSCLISFYNIIFHIIKNLDSPSRFIYFLLINYFKCKSCNENYISFISKNIKKENIGKIYEDYIKTYEIYENFIDELQLKISKEGLSIKYSNMNDILSIINKCSFKSLKIINMDSSNLIFGSNTEKFIISTLHSFDNYKIFY